MKHQRIAGEQGDTPILPDQVIDPAQFIDEYSYYVSSKSLRPQRKRGRNYEMSNSIRQLYTRLQRTARS